MSKTIEPRNAVKNLRGFSPDWPDRTIPELQQLFGREDVVKLSFNESPYGPSPQAVAALVAAVSQAHLYHDPEGKDLRSAIAEKYGVGAGNIILANGADEVISLIGQAFLSPQDQAIAVEPSFGQYAFVAKLMGAEPVAVPVRADLTADVEAIVRAINEQTKLIVLCNPNNPTGVITTCEELEYLAAHTPSHVLLVLDEAYAEYADDGKYASGVSLLERYENVIIVRTLSKIYGLAGLRLGYAIGHASLMDVINRVRSPFNVNALAQAAAVAALADEGFCLQAAGRNKAERERVTAALTAVGYKVYPSQTNFVFVDTGEDSTGLCEFLAHQGLIIRSGANWKLLDFVRITLGNAAQNDRLIEAVQSFKKIDGACPSQ